MLLLLRIYKGIAIDNASIILRSQTALKQNKSALEEQLKDVPEIKVIMTAKPDDKGVLTLQGGIFQKA